VSDTASLILSHSTLGYTDIFIQSKYIWHLLCDTTAT
jgi:hypothetical protein